MNDGSFVIGLLVGGCITAVFMFVLAFSSIVNIRDEQSGEDEMLSRGGK